MKTFFVKYASGVRQIVHSSDCVTVEAFCNMHFGSAWDKAKESGASVQMTDFDVEANLADPKYAPLFGEDAAPAPTPAPSPAPTPPANETQPDGTGATPPAPAPTGDATVQLTGTESSTETGGAGAA